MVENSLIGEFGLVCDKNPNEALDRLPAFLMAVDGEDPLTLAELYRLASSTARLVQDPARALELSSLASAEALKSGRRDQQCIVGMTHSYNLFLVGQVDEALNLIGSLDGGNDAALSAKIRLQEAAILARIGRAAEAEERFIDARHVAEQAGDLLLEARATKNLGMLTTEGGNQQQARQYFTAALRIFEQIGERREALWTQHALGITATKLGELPEAFRYFSESEEGLIDIAGADFELKRSRCEALIVAGLFTEAAETAEIAADQCLEAGLVVDAAEIRLMAAAAWLDAGENDASLAAASSAKVAFNNQHRPAWAASAALVAMEAGYLGGKSVDIEDVDFAIARAREGKLGREAMRGKLLSARLHLDADDVVTCEAVLDEVRAGGFDVTPDLALAAHLVAARAHDKNHLAEEVLREATDGFNVLRRIQSRVGSPLMLSGVTRHARQLGHLAIRAAVAVGDPLDVWDWTERLALRGSTPRPVSPPNDVQADVARRKLRTAPQGSQEVARLEAAIRDADLTIGVLEPDDLGDVAAPPSLDDTVILSYGIADGTIYGCCLFGGVVELTTSIPLVDVSKAIRALRSDQRRWALNPERAKPARIVAQLEALDQRLVPSLPLAASSAVVIPPPELFSLPWASLPSLRSRSTSVGTSVTTWLQKSDPTPPITRLLVAGPDLSNASSELDLIRADSDLVLDGQAATVDAVLAGLERADVAHVIAHGTTKSENPLFSSLQFADGWLNVYELGAMSTPPRVVVLSACHVGMTSDDAATAMLGMVTGLLHAGSDCVIASPVPVSDSKRLAELMARFHAEWSGRSCGPAEAWSAMHRQAQSTADLADLATFCLYGRG